MFIPIPLGDNLKQKGLPWATLSIILVSLAIFIGGRYASDAFALWSKVHLALKPDQFLTFWGGVFHEPSLIWTKPLLFIKSGILPALGHPFVHAQEVHLIGNMVFLWVFGAGLERRIGVVRFILFYVVCALSAMGVHLWLTGFFGVSIPFLPFPNPVNFAVGSSGPIAAIIGAWLVLFPFARIRILIFIIFVILTEVPVLILAVIWLLYQQVNTMDSLLCFQDCKAFSYLAHFAAIGIGSLLIWFFDRKRASENEKEKAQGKR